MGGFPVYIGPAISLLFFLGVAIYAGTALALQYWAIAAGLEFLRRYRDRHGLELDFEPAQLKVRYAEAPWRLILATPGISAQLKRLRTRPLDDAELEELRRRWRFRQGLVFVFFWLSIAIPVTFSSLGRWDG